MSKLEQIEANVRELSTREQAELREWLENLLEDQQEFTDEFKAKIERAKRDLAAGHGRLVKP